MRLCSKWPLATKNENNRLPGIKLKRMLLSGCALALLYPYQSSVADDSVVLSNNSTLLEIGGTYESTSDFSPVVEIPSDSSEFKNIGTVTTSGFSSDAVYVSGNDDTVKNNGTLQTSGDFSYGIYSDGSGSTLINNGTITTGGEGAVGIGADFDNASITNSGTISVTGDGALGIEALGDNSTLTNSGTITTAGDGAPGIGSQGDGSMIVNSGKLTTTGDGSVGIASIADGSTVTNSGTISTTGDGSDAIFVFGSGSTASNTGTLFTSGESAHGINSDGDGVNIGSSGTISTSGDFSDGIDSDGADAVISNSGKIFTNGLEADGIDNDGDDAVISNAGSISVSGEDSNGIESTGDGTAVTNSGTIVNTGAVSGSHDDVGHGISIVGDDATVVNTGKIFSSNGSSIYIDGSNAAVTLNSGTVLQGVLTFTDPSTATLNYAAGRTAILTFDGLPDTFSTGGLASFTSGSTVTIHNPDDFRYGSVAVTFNALTRNVTGSLESRMDANRLSSGSFVATNGAPAAGLSARNAIWTAPMGGFLSRQGENGFNHAFGGIIAGADRALAPNLRTGITGGFSLGRTESDDDVHSADSYSLFGGAYLSKDWQATFAQVSLLGGYLKSDEDVTVLNNMVSGGLQDLSIGYDYLHLNPSARIGHTITLEEGTLTPSARVRYAGLWQTGGANERTTGFAVSSRSLHILEVRAQAAYDLAPIVQDTGTLFVSFNAGVDGIFTLDDSIDASFAGAALNLSTDDDAVLRGFAKADAVWQANSGLKFLAGIEGGYDSAETLSAAVRLGAKMSF